LRRVAAVGAAIGLLAAACGGGGTATAVTVVRDAPKKTSDAHTSRVEVLIERPGAAGAQPTGPIRTTGEFDFVAHRGHMLIDLSQLGLPGPPIDAVYDNTFVYTKLPRALAPGLPAGKSWVKVDLAAAGRTIGVDVAGLSQGQAGDPSQTFDFLRGASDDVTRVGTEEVRGTQTTHYKAVLDLNKAAEESPSAREAIKSAIKVLGSSKQPADVWIDASGLLRRMRYVADLSKSKTAASTPGAPANVTFTIDLFDFGVPVNATVPPADQVVDLSALTGKSGGG
jgi:hypothetical protein